MEEFEENIIKHLQNDTDDLERKVCVQDSSLCYPTVFNDEL